MESMWRFQKSTLPSSSFLTILPNILDMNEIANKLWPEDFKLFANMEGHYISDNEKAFFEKMKFKMENEIAPSNDLIMFEEDNDEQIYIVRCIYDEFIVGHGTKSHYDEEYHVMNLSEALSANLKTLGFIDRDITLLEWLRERDYEGIRYNHNYAFM